MPPDQESLYLLHLAHSFFSDYSIYTITIDGEPAENYVKPLPGLIGPLGNIALRPGEHAFRVSFVDYDNVLIPAAMKTKTFQGWYDIRVRTKPGKYYAPRFRTELGERMADEICIIEADLSDSISVLRDSKNYIGCGTATVEVANPNIKVCQHYDRYKGFNGTLVRDPITCNVGREPAPEQPGQLAPP